MSEMPGQVVMVYDDLLPANGQREVLDFLVSPGWEFGGYSSHAPGASRYWFKHFAGIKSDPKELGTNLRIEEELLSTAPILARVWSELRREVLKHHRLARCYANAYPFGSEGSLHKDANLAAHFTSIYYPHLEWHPDYAGETVFFNEAADEIVAAVYPRPNRLVMFAGTIPHCARAVSRTCPTLRVTLMFKTIYSGATGIDS
jgi:SM-20-related protein